MPPKPSSHKRQPALRELPSSENLSGIDFERLQRTLTPEKMKQLLLLLVLLGLLIWMYERYYAGSEGAVNEPVAHEPHLAKEGTFFVLSYVSVPAPHGVIGFEPGREVHFVRADRAKGCLVVSDGQYEVEIKPSQLTNDLDVAALARKGDENSQHQIAAFIAHEKAVYDRVKIEENVRYARELDRINGRPSSGTAAPAGSPSVQNNPYSYLAPGSH